LIKKPPIQTPFFYDTKEGIDHFTKILKDESPHKYTDKDNAELNKLNLDMKKAALKHHNNQIKTWDGMDVKTYPSHPKQRGHLLAASSLEEDIKKNNINHNPKYNKKSKSGNPSGRNYWDEYVASGGKKLPEISPEDRNRPSATETWNNLYKSMTPFEKGTWNAQQRKKKLEKEKQDYEFNPTKMAQEVVDHTISKKLEPGLSHDFTSDKLLEGKIIKEVLDD